MKRRITENGKLCILEDETPVLCIREEVQDDTMYVYLEGSISLTAAHEFEDEMMAIMTVSRQIVLDFEKITYISAPGFQTLLTLQKIMDENNSGIMKLIHINQELFQSFCDIGFDALFDIEN